MLVHVLELGYSSEAFDYDYDNCKFIKAFTIKDYHRFIKFIKAMKGHECELEGNWYTIEEYTFQLPKDSETLPLIKVYVAEYFA